MLGWVTRLGKKKKTPVPFEMSDEEKDIVERYALGESDLKSLAEGAHYRCQHFGRGGLHNIFMSEIMNTTAPDAMYKADLRMALAKERARRLESR